MMADPGSAAAGVRIRDAGAMDAVAIASIYNGYVAGSVATFELEAVAADAMRTRVADVQARGLPWLLAECDAGVLGYAYAGPWRARAAPSAIGATSGRTICACPPTFTPRLIEICRSAV